VSVASREVCVAISWPNGVMEARLRGAEPEAPVTRRPPAGDAELADRTGASSPRCIDPIRGDDVDAALF